MELTLVDYDSIHFMPSLVAAAALCLSIRLLDNGEWVCLIITANFHCLPSSHLSDRCLRALQQLRQAASGARDEAYGSLGSASRQRQADRHQNKVLKFKVHAH